MAATAKLCLASFRVFLDLLRLHGSLEAIIFIVLFRFISCVVPMWFLSPEYGYLSSLKHHSIELVIEPCFLLSSLRFVFHIGFSLYLTLFPQQLSQSRSFFI